ncbi:DMT family transporter [Amycolatopsis magusensis]|uniref:Transporter family-2 protein n=1 Tax=Amycolatopsis magusensis TaxID=882444 RepID=A0ABS4PME2_9PSEU|nr:DMT family transporter [Amycolatopsis magusensis]MBP2180584.1 transporter family-2 protein [Amycolatopsis magusensis]
MSTASQAPEVAEPTGSAPSVAAKVLGVSLAVVSGVAMAVQGRINGQLGVELGDPMLAAVVSFGGGLILLFAALPFAPKMRAGLGKLRDAVREGTLRPWHCLGGLAGAMFVAGQALVVVAIGVAMFTVGVVAGQTVSSLAVDRAGLGPAGPRPLTWPRVAGAVLTLVAVVGSVAGGIGETGAGELWLMLLPLVAGCCVAVQQAVNGRVGAASGSALTATLGNFTVGFVALVLAWLISLLVRGGPTGLPSNPLLYAGGIVGILFISIASLVVKWTGVLLLGLAAIAGQLIGALLLDLLAPAHGERLAPETVGGVALALVAIGIAAFGGRRRRTRPGRRLPQ